MKVVLTPAEALQLERPVYMGSSIGGHLAGDLALNYPERFRAVIGINGTLATRSKRRVDPELSHHPRISNDAKAALMLSFTAPRAPEAYRRETVWGYSQGAPSVFKGDMHYFYVDPDLTETAGQIDTSRVAAYTLSGEYDVSSHPRGTPEMVRRIKGAKYVMMPGMGHFPMSENPELFKECIVPVLEEVCRTHAGEAS